MKKRVDGNGAVLMRIEARLNQLQLIENRLSKLEKKLDTAIDLNTDVAVVAARALGKAQED